MANGEVIMAVDPADYLSGDAERRQEFVETVGRGFHETGFLFVKTPELEQKMPEVYASFARVFDLPEEIKRKYERPEIHRERGWSPPFSETGITCRAVGPNGEDKPNAYQNWFIGPEEFDQIDTDHPEFMVENVWPEEVPEFKDRSLELYDDLYDTGRLVLRAVGDYLGYEEGFFDEKVLKNSPTVMRPLHYPAVTAEEAAETVWGCSHTDINLATILPPASKSGLWVRTRSGNWIAGKAPEGHSIAQVGDMLQHLTAGYFTSAVHKVVAPKEGSPEPRLSAAMFTHANPNFVLEPMGRYTEGSEDFPPIKAGDYLFKRLVEIGLVTPDEA